MDERFGRSGGPVPVHRLYRRAEEVEDHLLRIPVPPFSPAEAGERPSPQSAPVAPGEGS
jgi:hypothetical protein